jgi:Ser/Thr protein kinase RdoA (MazF antagonist)
VAQIREIEPRAVEANLLDEGKANSNYRLKLRDGTLCVLRFHVREPEAASLEASISELLAGELPIPRVLRRGEGFTLLEWMPGSTIERLLSAGRQDEVLSAAGDLGRCLAKISAHRFESAGFLDPDLHVASAWPSTIDGLFGYLSQCLQNPLLIERAGLEFAARVSAFVEQMMPRLVAGVGPPCLVHGDYKASNLLIDNGRLSGILDWEFAHSGTWLLDAGQLFRHRENLPQGFREEFELGFGQDMPSDWFELASTVDLVSHVDFLCRPSAGPKLIADVIRLAERNITCSVA